MSKKKLEFMLLKNTLAFTVPAMVVFIVLLFMFLNYPVFEQIKCVDIGNIENMGQRMEVLYNADTRNVKYIARELNYTGFDYYVDGKIKGAYYYTFNSGKMLVFLVKTNKPEMFIDELELKGRIIKDSVSTSHIINQFADSEGLDVTLFEGYCKEFVLSELDYPYAYITMIYVCFVAPIVACVLIILYTFVVWVNPSLHGQSKQLEEYGEVSEVIKEINTQLRRRLLFKKNNIYITDDYMIVNYLATTDIIKLDDIKFMSKNIVKKGNLFNRGIIYRLTLSDPERLFYEVDFVKEELIDEVVEYIRGTN